MELDLDHASEDVVGARRQQTSLRDAAHRSFRTRSESYGPLLGSFFSPHQPRKALISPVSRSGIAIFCNFLQLPEVSKTGEMKLSASFCSKLQGSRPLASANVAAHSVPSSHNEAVELGPRVNGITLGVAKGQFLAPNALKSPARVQNCNAAPALAQLSILSAAMKASCGISTLPNWRIFFLPAFCFSSSLRLRVASPP